MLIESFFKRRKVKIVLRNWLKGARLANISDETKRLHKVFFKRWKIAFQK